MIDFVYIYRHSSAKEDELRWSIRSIYTNYFGKFRIWICGDPPPWYDGNLIHVEGHGRKWQDTMRKLLKAATHPDITDDFVWMMDDVVFLQTIDEQFLRTPRAHKVAPFKAGDSEWAYKYKTTCAQFANPWHYGTHLPHVFNKQKIIELDRVWKMADCRWLPEELYGNTYFENPEPADKVLHYLAKPQKSGDDIDVMVSGKPVLVYSEPAWNIPLRDWLALRFNVQSQEEIQPAQHRYSPSRMETIKKMRSLKSFKPIPEMLQCEHRGEMTNETTTGPNCGFRDNPQEIYFCEVYGRCTLKTTGAKGIKGCNKCPIMTSKFNKELENVNAPG